MKGDRQQIAGVICSEHAWRAGFADRVADDDVIAGTYELMYEINERGLGIPDNTLGDLGCYHVPRGRDGDQPDLSG
jgi:hypothetical protein